jgi:hypothetical protein
VRPFQYCSRMLVSAFERRGSFVISYYPGNATTGHGILGCFLSAKTSLCFGSATRSCDLKNSQFVYGRLF